MSTTTRSDAVPLNIWLPDEAETPTSGSDVRRHIADRVIETYSPPGGVIVDLAPGRGEVLAAAAKAGRAAVVLHLPLGCTRRPGPPLDAVNGTADLAIVVPPASHLRPPRTHPLSATAAGVASRQAAPLLRTGGFLVLGSLGCTAAAHLEPVSNAVSAAGQAGLAYYQHVVALLVHELDAAPGATGSRGRRRLAHADLLVFVKEQP